MLSLLSEFMVSDLAAIVIAYELTPIARSSRFRPFERSQDDFIKRTCHNPTALESLWEQCVRTKFNLHTNPFPTWKEYYNYLLALLVFPADVRRIDVPRNKTLVNPTQNQHSIIRCDTLMYDYPFNDTEPHAILNPVVIDVKPKEIIMTTSGNCINNVYVAYDRELMSQYDSDYNFAETYYDMLTQISPLYFRGLVDVWTVRLTLADLDFNVQAHHFGYFEGVAFLILEHLGVRYGIVFKDWLDPSFPVEQREKEKLYTFEQYQDVLKRIDYSLFNRQWMALTCVSYDYLKAHYHPIYEFIHARYNVSIDLMLHEREGLYFYESRHPLREE